MLRTRVITAVILLLLLIGATTLLDGFTFSLFVSAVVLLAAWEWGGLFGFDLRRVRLGFLCTLALTSIGVFFALGLTPGVDAIDSTRSVSALILGSAFWLFVLVLLRQYPGRAASWNEPSKIAVMGLFALVPTLVGVIELKFLYPNGLLVLALIVLVAAVDIGAYFAGTYFGRRKLAPQISPNKTWEGVWGGLALCTVVCALLALGLHSFHQPLTTTSLLLLLSLGPVVTFFSVVGDLLESMLKRNADIKDSGQVLPGHGGLLDRIDGLLAATPPATLLLLLVSYAGGL